MLPRADPQRFVGRHRQLVALSEALEARSRLVTLHGPSGVGKSRLAAEHLRGVAEERRIAAVDLEDATSLQDALALTASALEAPAAAGPDPVHVLAERLRELGPLTLVLDHVDGVSGELSGPLSRWLAMCPETHFVITALRPLSLPGEHPCAVEPLSLPVSKSDRVPSDALRLWHLLRGSEARRDKPVDAELVELLRALGGLPLLIELMAALAERLTPFALLERLSPKLRALGPSPTPDAVLGSVLDAVWSAMSEAERHAFARCGVFGPSFDRAAFAAVHEPVSREPALSADEALSRLGKRRLLSQLHTTDGSERFGLHFALRRAARQRLAALDTRGEAERRHARFFVEKGGALAEALEGKDGPSATRALVREQGNLLAIVGRPPVAGDVEQLSVLLRALCVHDHVLSSFGPVDADLGRLDRALAAAEGLPIERSVLTEALCVRAFVRGRTGAFEQSFADLARAQALADEPGMRDTYPAGRVAVTVAFVCLSAGRLDEAEAEAGKALAIADRVGHLRLRGIALGVYALIRRVRGHEGEARSLYEQALENHRAVENRRFEGIVMTRLAQLLADAGELERALVLADDARLVHQNFGDRLMEGLCLEVRGIVTQARGELEDARRALEAARPLLAAAGQTTATHALLARVRTELGDFDLARQLLELSRRDHLARGAQAEALLSLARAAGLDALFGDVESAQASFAEIDRYEVEGLGAALVGIERAQLDLYELRTALREGDAARATELRTRALERREQLARALAHARGARFRELADAQASLRVFDMLLAGHGTVSPGAVTVLTAGGAGLAQQAGVQRGALALSLATRSFVAPGGERVDVSERPALRRILTRLAVKALRAPGSPHRALELFAAGWPGENPGEENARLQVYAVLATLRKLGLGDALISNDQGHMLSPGVAVRFTA